MQVLFTKNHQPAIIRLTADDIASLDEEILDREFNVSGGTITFQIPLATGNMSSFTVQMEDEDIQVAINSVLSVFLSLHEAMEPPSEPCHCSDDLGDYKENFDYEGENLQVCAICFSERASSKIVLNCNHKYHYACLYQWFEKNNSCPKCRAPIQPCLLCDSTRVINSHSEGGSYRGVYVSDDAKSFMLISALNSHEQHN